MGFAVTLRIVDVSKYQVERRNPLNLVTARGAGIGAVNIALDRGRDVDVLPAWAPGYAVAARDLGMGVSTYRWLDGRLPGRVSARRAYERMISLGGPDGMAHAVDTEETPDKGPPATERIIREYVEEMTFLLGRPIALYTGDWWWTAAGRNWRVVDSAPYLWAAPNGGYLGEYPGDDSPHWTAGYGGWPTLSVMQYAVKPLPGTGDCSLSAVRDPAVRQTLTGEAMTYADPALVTARNYLISQGVPGASIGIVGDRSHRSSGGYHVGNDVLSMIGKLHTDYSKRQTEKDRPGSNAAMALDIGGLSGKQLSDLTNWLIAQCRAGTPDTRNIREVIGRRSTSGGVILYDALGIRDEDEGSADHATHTHLSYYRDSEGEDKTAVFRRYFQPASTPKPPLSTAAGTVSNKEEDTVLITFVYAKVGGQDRWGLGVVSGGEKFWFEANSQERADAYSITLGKSAKVLSSASAYEVEKAQFVGMPA